MIPKIIHYCWFGKNSKPDLVQKCIESWKKFCPDYEIIEWNEDNYDVFVNEYTKKAYEENAWAFVSDYARLDILLKNGGIYLDTDVEIISSNPFDRYLGYSDVLAFENARGISSGMIYATEANSKLCYTMLDCYKNQDFDKTNLKLNTQMNKEVINEFCSELEYTGITQIFDKIYIMGCEEYGKLMKHYGMRTWCENLPEYKVKKSNALIRKLRNPKTFAKIENKPFLLKPYQFLVYDLYDLGLLYFIKLKINQIAHKKVFK